MLLHNGSTIGASRIEFHGTHLITASQTVYTFSDIPIGNVEPSRLVMVVAYAERTDPEDETYLIVDDFDFGGVSQRFLTWSNTGGFARETLLEVVSEGETTDIVIDLNNTASLCEIAVFSIYNMAFNFDDYFTSNISYPTYVSSTSWTNRVFEGGVVVFATNGIKTFTGFGSSFAGTHISGAYLLAEGAETARSFTASSALVEDYEYGGGGSLGP